MALTHFFAISMFLLVLASANAHRYASDPEFEKPNSTFYVPKPDLGKPKTTPYMPKPELEKPKGSVYVPKVVPQKPKALYAPKPEVEEPNVAYVPKPKFEKPKKNEYGCSPQPEMKKPETQGKLLPYILGIQGLIYCKSGSELLPIQGALARITCLATAPNGYELAPFSFLSRPTGGKGYFFSTVSLHEVEDGWKLTGCKAFLEKSQLEPCKVPT
ncbi:hypothetical protein NMG60_11033879 [Bertholletia excelsa]